MEGKKICLALMLVAWIVYPDKPYYFKHIHRSSAPCTALSQVTLFLLNKSAHSLNLSDRLHPHCGMMLFNVANILLRVKESSVRICSQKVVDQNN